MNTIRIFSLLFILVIFNSCIDEEVIDIEDTVELNIPDPSEIISTTVYGRVVDVDNMPIADAIVTCHSCLEERVITTDLTGNFLFLDIQNKGKSAYITVEYSGMFEAFRRMGVLADRYNYTEVQLNEKVLIGELDSKAGGTLELESGASISLPADGIVDENGDVFSGEYSVFASWIHPDAENLSQNMIGDLSGIDDTGALMALSTFGMLVVELIDESDNELNLADGHEAEIKFPVPDNMLANAPNTIPLWSYNEEHGYWIEEGSADLIDAFYIGKVSHFSSWNVDTKGPAIEISGIVSIVNEFRMSTEYGASYYQVIVCSSSIGQRGGWLCDDGSFLFYNFPANEEFTIKVLDYCGNEVFKEDYEGFSNDSELESIVIDGTSGVRMVSFTGNYIDCNLEPISDALVTIDFGDRKYVYEVQDGTFDIPFIVCEGFEGELSIINLEDLTKSNTIAFTDLDPTFEFKDVIVCENFDNYFYLNIEGAFEKLVLEIVGVSATPLNGVFDINFEIHYMEELNPGQNLGAFTLGINDIILNSVISGSDESSISIIEDDYIPIESSGENIQFLFSEFDYDNRVAVGEFYGFLINTFESNGIQCWDLNENGIGDPSEDINADGVFSELDCKYDVHGSFRIK